MRERFLLVLVGFFLAGAEVRGQCDDCLISESDSGDYCYKNDLFIDHCASFTDKSDHFWLKVGKNPKQIPYQDTAGVKFFLALADNKKLKLKTEDILFIQEALKVWEVEKKSIGFSFTESGLGIKILQEGTGEIPRQNDVVNVHYVGYLEDGTKFDSSIDRNVSFSFVLGAGRVIKGWDEGFRLLNRGTKAILKIPPELGYGSRGAGRMIPPNAVLIFEVELLK